MLNIYRASAGSGKTFQLTKTFISFLFDGRNRHIHRRIMAVTFTNKATEEMRSRIVAELHRLACGEQSAYRTHLCEQTHLSENEVNARAKEILYDILHDWHFFTVSTIDSFFQQILRAFAREIGVAGNYSVALDTDLALQQAADNLFINIAQPEKKQLLDWLTDFAQNSIEEGGSWNIRQKIVKLGSEIFNENFQMLAENTHTKLSDKVFLKNYQKNLKKIADEYQSEVKNKTQEILTEMKNFGLQHEDFSHKRTQKFEKLLQNPADELGSRILEMHDVEKCYTKNSPAKALIENAFANGLSLKINNLIDFVEKNRKFFISAEIISENIAHLGILSDLLLEIKQLMSEENNFLLSDTNMLLSKIIAQNDSPFVYEKTGIFIDHFMIDEFQDTSTLQWRNFKPLINNALAQGKGNMLVGDVKQSIYRWRNSDWNLLDSEVQKDFNAQQITENQLETNYRSDHNIVHFNNALFDIAPQILCNTLKDNPIAEKITRAYHNAAQKIRENVPNGYVRFQFIKTEKDEEETWKEMALKQLPEVLENLQLRGFQPERVGILVRKKAEAQQITDFLLNYKNSSEAKAEFCYDVIGNEGFRLEKSPAVRFLINLLKTLQNPENTIVRKIAETELENQNVANKTFSNKISDDNLQKFSTLPLYEMTETIIAYFSVGQWKKEAVFVQAFQDVVYQFVTRKSASLGDFLLWWNENGVKQTLAVPEKQRAFRVMTIHKSKGLDFEAVVMPFAEWELETTGQNAAVLWCKTELPPLSELPIFPVKYGKKMSESIFTAEYYTEKMLQLVDNLNLAYVAFTRAKHELICFAPYVEKDTNKCNLLSALLLQSFFSAELAPFYNSETHLLEIGEPSVQKKQTDIADTNITEISNYPSYSFQNKLKIKRM